MGVEFEEFAERTNAAHPSHASPTPTCSRWGTFLQLLPLMALIRRSTPETLDSIILLMRRCSRCSWGKIVQYEDLVAFALQARRWLPACARSRANTATR